MYQDPQDKKFIVKATLRQMLLLDVANWSTVAQRDGNIQSLFFCLAMPTCKQNEQNRFSTLPTTRFFLSTSFFSLW